MSYSGFYEGDDPAAMYQMLQQRGMRGPPKRFDEYYRCYPTIMIPGPERDNLNYGGKIIMPPSALEKLTRLHITYPMLFELINSRHPDGPKLTHAGVLEFIADEGKVYLPHWMMQTLGLETGDLFQIKSTDLPPASLIKLQPQSVNFLDISNPKAVLEKAFRDFSTVTKGDIFSFHYNDTIYDIAVLEVKPVTDKMGVSMLETDVEVDFAAPLGYVEPTPVRGNGSGTSTPRSAIGGLPAGGMLHSQGTMAQAINYDAIAPTSNSVAQGAKAASSNFVSGGHKLSAKKGTKTPTPTASTPVAGASTNTPAVSVRRTNGPQPLRLPPNKLFFGYEVKPVKTQADKDKENADAKQPHFSGQGQSLKTGKKVEAKSEPAPEPQAKSDSIGRRLDGKDANK
ncbi:putative ubiquitin fusion degradation protein ufd1 protein [Botrytis fragariae]|uniref:Ubiquitin fusion degradation protein 1 n=1 Tax=Botrytis fragariae TaxID=1964551 RepID=A0A8H6AVL1_9HELO|nr:putative ubiquitin fusion degradation protein ufd1 protein [Botrytis fragariae]KAF5874265.1 putative ubiquitin fusion degradation protein ufd1 protein [Botrytis fragariae]